MNSEERTDVWLEQLLRDFASAPLGPEQQRTTDNFLERCRSIGATAFALRSARTAGPEFDGPTLTIMERLVQYVCQGPLERQPLLRSCGIDEAQPLSSAVGWGSLCRHLNIPRDQAIAGYRKLITSHLELMQAPQLSRARASGDFRAHRFTVSSTSSSHDEPALTPLSWQLYREAEQSFLAALQAK
ncbi:MAG: hypothetical protein ACKOU6_08345 [Planctomycetota bacterium]